MPPRRVVLRPFYCRIGSKRDLTKFIMNYFPDPDTYDTYVEPFIGGGALYWKKEPTTNEVINDLDSALIRDYRLLKTVKSRDFRTDLNTIEKLQRFVNTTHGKEADKLTAAVINRCNKWIGKEEGDIYQESNPYGKLKKLDAYQERMKDTKIENESYDKMFAKYDSPRTFFYLDPPYEETKKTGKLYKHGGMTFDYEKFRDVLAKAKGKWLLSINDSPNIRALFKGYFFKAFTVKAKGLGMGSLGSKPRKELLISNYGGK